MRPPYLRFVTAVQARTGGCEVRLSEGNLEAG